MHRAWGPLPGRQVPHLTVPQSIPGFPDILYSRPRQGRTAIRPCRTPGRGRPAEIGFVSHNRPSGALVAWWKLAFFRTIDSKLRPARHSRKLGLFRTTSPRGFGRLVEIGFVLHNPPFASWADRRQLGLFRTNTRHVVPASPGGTIEHSPPFQRWESGARISGAPQGRKKHHPRPGAFFRP
jgi:hypothetical protein